MSEKNRYVCKCGKKYKNRNGLWYHNKKCSKPNVYDTPVNVVEKKYVNSSVSDNHDNVIFIIKNTHNSSDNAYIFDKCKNFEKALSKYNKTLFEYEIIYSKSCRTKGIMDLVEEVVFHKLNRYRERFDRKRFILPADKHVSFFCDVIDKCIQFVEE